MGSGAAVDSWRERAWVQRRRDAEVDNVRDDRKRWLGCRPNSCSLWTLRSDPLCDRRSKSRAVGCKDNGTRGMVRHLGTTDREQ